MKRRPNILIYMETLDLVLDGPKGHSRLSQAMGLNFNKFLEFAAFLKAKELIRSEEQEGHELYLITQRGLSSTTTGRRSGVSSPYEAPPTYHG